ncbi:helix-turn-helix domain-containing protein [Pseudomonas corrugata]|uniref:helix-turn-helix domain-containing protein n=1 Tax=Pseudomonas corrugata TaxID=47879 RepID=UPI0009BFFF0F
MNRNQNIMTLISITQAAILLGIGRTTAYRLAKEGRIPCVRSFGPLRVHAEKLQALIDAEAEASVTPILNFYSTEAARSATGQPRIGISNSPTHISRELDRLLQPPPKHRCR